MKLSVDNRPGHLQVVGGRVLRVIREHHVPTAPFDSGFDDNKMVVAASGEIVRRRIYAGPWETALRGDLAVEVRRTDDRSLIGHLYLTRDVANLLRYVPSPVMPQMPDPVFGPGQGARFDMSRAVDMEPDVFAAAMLSIKHSGADVAIATLDLGLLEARALLTVVSAALWSGVARPTNTHIFCSIGAGPGRMYLHHQPPCHVSDFTTTPFAYALLLSSSDLATLPFAAANQG